MFCGTAQFSIRFVSFLFFSSVCLFVHVTMEDKSQGCRLLFDFHIGHNVIQKEEEKKA